MYLSTHIWEVEDSLVVQMAESLPAMQKTWVQSLGQKDPLEKEMATYSSILAWKIPWIEEPGRLQSMGSQRVRHIWEVGVGVPHILLRPMCQVQTF